MTRSGKPEASRPRSPGPPTPRISVGRRLPDRPRMGIPSSPASNPVSSRTEELDMNAPAIGRRRESARPGLHGHPLEGNMARAAVAEATGTFVLVLTIVSTVIAAALARPVAGAPYGSLAVPVAGGVALAALAVSLGPVSGAHLNPAVTLGLAVNRRFPWTYVPAYMPAQFAG